MHQAAMILPLFSVGKGIVGLIVKQETFYLFFVCLYTEFSCDFQVQRNNNKSLHIIVAYTSNKHFTSWRKQLFLEVLPY